MLMLRRPPSMDADDKETFEGVNYADGRLPWEKTAVIVATKAFLARIAMVAIGPTPDACPSPWIALRPQQSFFCFRRRMLASRLGGRVCVFGFCPPSHCDELCQRDGCCRGSGLRRSRLQCVRGGCSCVYGGQRIYGMSLWMAEGRI